MKKQQACLIVFSECSTNLFKVTTNEAETKRKNSVFRFCICRVTETFLNWRGFCLLSTYELDDGGVAQHELLLLSYCRLTTSHFQSPKPDFIDNIICKLRFFEKIYSKNKITPLKWDLEEKYGIIPLNVAKKVRFRGVIPEIFIEAWTARCRLPSQSMEYLSRHYPLWNRKQGEHRAAAEILSGCARVLLYPQVGNRYCPKVAQSPGCNQGM